MRTDQPFRGRPEPSATALKITRAKNRVSESFGIRKYPPPPSAFFFRRHAPGTGSVPCFCPTFLRRGGNFPPIGRRSSRPAGGRLRRRAFFRAAPRPPDAGKALPNTGKGGYWFGLIHIFRGGTHASFRFRPEEGAARQPVHAARHQCRDAADPLHQPQGQDSGRGRHVQPHQRVRRRPHHAWPRRFIFIRIFRITASSPP